MAMVDTPRRRAAGAFAKAGRPVQISAAGAIADDNGGG
jgi:hypothetical protein